MVGAVLLCAVPGIGALKPQQQGLGPRDATPIKENAVPVLAPETRPSDKACLSPRTVRIVTMTGVAPLADAPRRRL